MKRRSPVVLLTALLLAAGCDARPPAATTAPAGARPQSLPTTQVAVNGTTLTLQVADDDDERQVGLMHTRSMPAGHGMIFVFPGETELGFWMKNTPIDLDIIYVDHAGKVVSVKTMKAYDLTNTPSDGPATYAIELNAGEAVKLKIEAGQTIALPPELAAKVK